MSNLSLLVPFVAVALLALGACQESLPVENSDVTPDVVSAKKSSNQSLGRIAVANRNSGTISIIDADTDEVEGTYTLPGDSPQPMYIVWSQATNRVFVGDRANNSVVVFDGDDFSVVGSVPAGNGVFHMWADVKAVNQLWVNNDIDNTTTVINPLSLSVIATVPTPADLVALGGKPHDVLVSPDGNYAYVSIIGVEGDNDYVVQFSTTTFQETARAAVGQDPHLSATFANNALYVPCQNSNAIFVLNRSDLSFIETIDAPGAHGAGMPFNGETFYTTNLPAGGTGGLIAVNTSTNTVSGADDTPFAVPHNIALAPNLNAAPDAQKLYITHSGATANQVSVYDVSGSSPSFVTSIETGLNPFGIAFIR
ncbi:MAG: YncE family protein [Rhodothermaceae bacterium]|nr:YncE family protein [Rhodothermaceae bacterium]